MSSKGSLYQNDDDDGGDNMSSGGGGGVGGDQATQRGVSIFRRQISQSSTLASPSRVKEISEKAIDDETAGSEQTPKPLVEKLYTTMDEEFDEVVTEIKGDIPYPMQGTLYQIGPGRFQINEQNFNHLFDGDGYVRAFVFEGGKVHFRTRFVRTKKFVQETKEQKVVFRGFGNQPVLGWWEWAKSLPNIPHMDSNPANSGILFHGGKLLALWDGGHPYLLDPVTLDTLGPYTFDGCLRPDQLFGSRYKLDPFTGDLFNIGQSRSGKPELHLYQVDRNGNMILNGTVACSRAPGLVQDWILTDSWIVVLLDPVDSTDLISRVATLNQPYYTHYRHNTELDSLYVIIRRQDFVKIGEVPCNNEQCLAWRLSNGYVLERETGLVLEFLSAHYVDLDILKQLAPPFRGTQTRAQMWRHEINLSKGAMERPSTRLLSSRFIETFSWDPRKTSKPTRFYYSAASSEKSSLGMTAVQKFDAHTGAVWMHDFKPNFVSDPVFIPYAPTTQEEEGYVLVTVYNPESETTSLVFLDARAIELPPVCTVTLPYLLPVHVQSHFVPGLLV